MAENEIVRYSRNFSGSFSTFLQLYNTANLKSTEQSARRIVENTSRISEGIEALGSQFNYGMTLMLTELQAQSDISQGILDKLESIDETLKSPYETRAKEWINKGNELLANGVLDLALKAFKKSVEIFDLNFFAHMQLGKIYLYGVDKDHDFFRPALAKKHFVLAAKLAKSKANNSLLFAKYAAECYFHASVSCYVQANCEKDRPHLEDYSYLLYCEAVDNAYQADKIRPSFSENFYHLIKYQCIVNELQAAGAGRPLSEELVKDYLERLQFTRQWVEKCIRLLIEKDKSYLDKFSKDTDFLSVQSLISSIEQLEVKAKHEIASHLIEFNQELEQYLQKATRFSSQIIERKNLRRNRLGEKLRVACTVCYKTNPNWGTNAVQLAYEERTLFKHFSGLSSLDNKELKNWLSGVMKNLYLYFEWYCFTTWDTGILLARKRKLFKGKDSSQVEKYCISCSDACFAEVSNFYDDILNEESKSRLFRKALTESRNEEAIKRLQSLEECKDVLNSVFKDLSRIKEKVDSKLATSSSNDDKIQSIANSVTDMRETMKDAVIAFDVLNYEIDNPWWIDSKILKIIED